MVLNDVGAWNNCLMTDISRGRSRNGRYSDRQRILYECALTTPDHMFRTIEATVFRGFVAFS